MLQQPLGGLGIKSDVGIMFDGVSIGATHFARHETLLLIGCSHTDARTGELRAQLIAAPSMGMFHDGTTQAALVLRALQSHPVQLGTRELRARVAIVGGDGAVARGGEEAIHSSTGTAELVWDTVFKPRALVFKPEDEGDHGLRCVQRVPYPLQLSL